MSRVAKIVLLVMFAILSVYLMGNIAPLLMNVRESLYVLAGALILIGVPVAWVGILYSIYVKGPAEFFKDND